jgi:hypothetical protein
MNGEESHLLDATVDLFNPSETNFASQSSDVNPLLFRVMQVVRAYFEGRCCSGALIPVHPGDPSSAGPMSTIPVTAVLTMQVISEQVADEC